MLYRKLGNTGYDVSTVGFGTWQIGGGRWEVSSEEERIALLRKANDLGVNIFDVAVVYGQYKDENGYLQSKAQELLGQAFEKKRKHVIYCVKLGQFDEFSHQHDYQAQRIVHQFQQSLRRLKTDYIDIALIHAPSIAVVKNQSAISVLQTLKALGHIKSIGYSFEAEPEHVQHTLSQKIDVIMLQYNLLDQECAESIALAREHGIGILVGGPFKRGYLTGQYKNSNDFPKDDDYWQWNITNNPGKVEHILNRVNEMLNTYGTPENLRQESLRFILSQQGSNSCIIGHRNIEEVIENINAVNQFADSLTFKPVLIEDQAKEDATEL
ncbi:MAG: aldo/keto reductase [Pseudomonadota bacterium]